MGKGGGPRGRGEEEARDGEKGEDVQEARGGTERRKTGSTGKERDLNGSVNVINKGSDGGIQSCADPGRTDACGESEIDQTSFFSLARRHSELEKLLKSVGLERAIAAALVAGLPNDSRDDIISGLMEIDRNQVCNLLLDAMCNIEGMNSVRGVFSES